MISSIRLDNVDLNDDGFKRFLSTKTGQLTFGRSDRRLLIDPRDDGSCDNQCPCQVDRAQLMKKVCSFVRCSKLTCENPIQPPGHCCPLCAVMVKVAPKDDLSFSDFNRILTSYMKDRPVDGTIGYGYSLADKSMLAVFANTRDSSFEKNFHHGKNFVEYLYYGKVESTSSRFIILFFSLKTINSVMHWSKYSPQWLALSLARF